MSSNVLVLYTRLRVSNCHQCMAFTTDSSNSILEDLWVKKSWLPQFHCWCSSEDPRRVFEISSSSGNRTMTRLFLVQNRLGENGLMRVIDYGT